MEKILNRDTKLQIIRAYLEHNIPTEEIEKKYSIDGDTIRGWIHKFFSEANRFFENENLTNDIDGRLKVMNDTIREKEKIISTLERDNYELKKIIYTFNDEEE
jgi:transposase-like protein